ncbi:unnamed protein product [Vitrella brassicaformis CCMP3155]|uniref:Hcy-binding domain-containing protein n=1 Tax=Vitrella brassicaformis (strain CCMP3155) TaxID=1169540 RepID=A0A0G4FZA9_VITBC|nr:unnamed protein product [Vitrella brassicaformis CCMP3155]|eukprot:CEM20965.1 unnamed protein product [Vitrella brassicaformis CCMP3155]
MEGFMRSHPVVLLDGGLATELERQGYDLNHPLWSARLLTENPAAIRDAHLRFFDAGLSPSESRALFHRAIDLAVEARGLNGQRTGKDADKLIIGSCGPYGAYLADGAEYRGNYGVDPDVLRDFHRERLAVLLETGKVDGIVFETVPDRTEAKVIVSGVLREFPDLRGCVWLSFSCSSGSTICCGESFRDTVNEMLQLDARDRFLCGIGVNCSSPDVIIPLLCDPSPLAPSHMGSVRLIAYPNSGEQWDTHTHSWCGPRGGGAGGLADYVGGWVDGGVSVVGGCCRTFPDDIALMRSRLDERGGEGT